MSDETSENWLQQIGQKMVSLRPFSWFSARTLHHIDPLVYKISSGRFTMVSLAGGLPMFMLTTTGAKSGRKRSVPLVGIPDSEKIVVIASNWGQKHYPGWYHNLKADPRVEIDQDGTSAAYIAREATSEEYESYWNRAVSIYGGYNEYKKRAGGRRIPVIVLEPVKKTASA